MWPFRKKKEVGETQYAEITTRLSAFTFDLLIIFIFVYYLTDFIMSLYYPNGSPMLALTAVATSQYPDLANNTTALIQYLLLKYPNEMRQVLEHFFFSHLVQYFVIGLYVIPMNWKYGATLGKKLMGIKVVDLITGKNLTLTQSIIRYIGYLPSVIPLGIGIIWGSFHKRKRCWHDYIGDSLVIYDENRWYKKYFERLKAYFNLK